MHHFDKNQAQCNKDTVPSMILQDNKLKSSQTSIFKHPDYI